MREDKKYIWWGLLGIGVAAFFYFLSSKNKTQTIQIPYLVPQSTPPQGTGQPSNTPTISEQPNIIGNHPNNTVANGTIPSHVNGIDPIPPAPIGQIGT